VRDLLLSMEDPPSKRGHESMLLSSTLRALKSFRFYKLFRSISTPRNHSNIYYLVRTISTWGMSGKTFVRVRVPDNLIWIAQTKLAVN